MHIHLIIFPAVNPKKVIWPCVPRKGEQVFYKDIKYNVSNVIHNIVENQIKVLLMPA